MRKSIHQTLSLWCLFVLLKTTAVAQPTGWSVNPSDFANSMSITAQVYLDGSETNDADNWLAAFVGSELRGVQAAQIISGKAYFFLTVYSDVTSGEIVDFKVYHAPSDEIKAGLENVDFLKNNNIGAFPDGFDINVSSANDFPISLLPRDPDSTLVTYPFQEIELDSLLITQDDDPIAWTHVNGTNLTASIVSGNVLTIIPDDPMWTGTDSIEIIATETGTSNEYSASQHLYFTIEEDYGVPVFGNLPLQFVQGNLPTPRGELSDHLDFDGPCIDYYFELLLPQGDQSMPSWTQPGSNSGSMSMTVKVDFGGNPFLELTHKLAGFVDGHLAGVAAPQVTQGKVLYFISLSNVGEGAITFQFYDSNNFYLHEKLTVIDFEPAGSVGDLINPFVIDLAPISVNISSDGEWATSVVEPDWTGYQQVRFFAEDCKYRDKVDSTDMVFAFNQCNEQTVSLPADWGLCLQAEAIASDVVWYRNGTEVDTGHFLAALDTGFYQYEGLTPNGCPNIKGCPVEVTGISGHPIPIGGSPPLPSVWANPPFCGLFSYTDITVDDTPPTAICKNRTVSLDSNGMALLSIGDVDNGSFTSCGSAYISISVDSFFCQDVGMKTVELVVKDAAGRSDSCSATITVEDNIMPSVHCRDRTLQVDATGFLNIVPNDVLWSSSDNCGAVTLISVLPNSFTCGQNGGHLVTLQVEDSNGNINSCAATVTVDDSVYPCCPPTNIVYVNESTEDDDDGSDWDNAFATLERALELASRCSIVTEIWVAKGVYFPTSGTDRSISFTLQNGVAVYGGFSGMETNLFERDFNLNESVLSGDIGVSGDNSDNSFHIVANIGGSINSTAILDGFTIRDGYANGIGNDEKGGGIINRNTSPSIRHCSFMDNFAALQGGGIHNFNASPNVDSCRFKSNRSEVGGAVYNSACYNGGFSGCTFKENSASMMGGAIFNTSSNLSVANSLFIGNSASVNGGGIANIDSSPDIVNSVMSLNIAENGSGVYNLAGSDPTITNCTFFANTASPSSGVIRNNTDTEPTITNCILWGNGREIVDSSPGATVSQSIVEGGHPGTGNMDVDPLFVDSFDLRITPCSPAVDAGDNAANNTLNDLMGNDRIFNASGTANIDLGAYEMPVDLSQPCIWTGNGDDQSWSDPLNWSDLFETQRCRDVLIPAGYNVTVPNSYEALGNTLEVELGAEIETKPMATLDIGN